jgi:WXG100 protein secretion system (Wss), protein YukD
MPFGRLPVDRVIVTVKLANEARVRDVELPANVPMAQLARALAQRLGWNQEAGDQQLSYDVEVYPPGRRLNPNETLAQASAWDGAWLVFYPRQLDASPVAPKLDIAWEPIDRPSAKADTSAPTEPASIVPPAAPGSARQSPLEPAPVAPPPPPATPGSSPPLVEDPASDADDGEGPVTGWIPLGLPNPSANPAEQQPPQDKPSARSETPRGWRRIDED